MASKQKTSSAWNYFTEEDGTPFAVCKLCSAKIKRGKDGDKKTWSSAPLWAHLRRKHQNQFREATESREKAEQAVKKRKLEEDERRAVYVNGTPKLGAFLEKKEKYKPNDPEQKSLTDLLTTWIADGVLPYELL